MRVDTEKFWHRRLKLYASRKLGCYFASRKKTNDPQGREISLKRFGRLFHAPPLRNSLGWSDFLSADLFDRAENLITNI
jgi:hypothetical protein